MIRAGDVAIGKLRYAVAFCGAPVTLAAVASGLSELGIPRDQIHLVANDETLAAASRDLALAGHTLRLTEIARCVTWRETQDEHPWVLELLAESAAADGAPTRPTRLGDVAQPRNAPPSPRLSLNDHWQRGGGVVIVRLAIEPSERDVCGLMLRHSASVQTHDLRPLA